MKKTIFTLILTSFSLLVMAQSAERKVLFIGIDGCRFDAIVKANTPGIDELLSNALYSDHGLTEYTTWSGTGWSGMLTGVWHTKHGVTDNTFNGSNYGEYPDFISRAENHNPGLSTYSVVHWSPLNTTIIQSIDNKISVPTDLEVKNIAVNILNNNNPDILFVAFDDVDHAGHSHGFSPDIPQYIQSIEITDQYISELISALKNRPNYAQEDWLIVVTTDHGGTISGHGGGTLEERTIFNIFSNPGFEQQYFPRNTLTTTVTFDEAHFISGTFAQPIDQSPFEFGTSQDFTIEFWVKAIEYTGDPSFVSNKNWNSGRNAGFVISAQQGQYWKVNIGDGVDRLDIQGGYIQPGQWHHLAVSFDRDGLMTAYEDGAVVGFDSMTLIGNINTGLPLIINQDGTTTYGFNFEGNYKDVRIWNDVVPESTITEWAAKPVNEAHPYYDKLIANWTCEDGSGSLLEDASPNNNDCNVIGNIEWNNDMTDTFIIYDYSETPRIPDNAVTVLNWFCIPLQESWNLVGKSWLNPCITGSTEDFESSFQFSINPNPTSDQINLIVPVPAIVATEMTLFDAAGRQLRQFRMEAGLTEYKISMESLIPGTYILKITQGKKYRSAKIIKK